MNSDKSVPLAVLTYDQYVALERQVPGATTLVTHLTTELQAGYQLGVQAVLATLRNGFVSGAR